MSLWQLHLYQPVNWAYAQCYIRTRMGDHQGILGCELDWELNTYAIEILEEGNNKTSLILLSENQWTERSQVQLRRSYTFFSTQKKKTPNYTPQGLLKDAAEQLQKENKEN